VKPTIIFSPGFGCHEQLYQEFLKEFEDFDIIFWNHGYFGKKSKKLVAGSIGIGHSLGFYKILEDKQFFKAVISLAGFFDFLSGSKKRYLELNGLKEKFESSPHEGLDTFYKFMGLDQKTPSISCQKTLLNDLNLLYGFQASKIDQPLLALQAKDDPIVTHAVFEKNFKEHRSVYLESGGHLFFKKEPALVANYIKNFLRELKI